MEAILKAVRFRNLDEARQVLENTEGGEDLGDILLEGEDEPDGLLAIIPEDRVPEEVFQRLFDQKKGTLIEVQKIFYTGYGPPAEEEQYMGFAGEQVAYVVRGHLLPIQIEGCPQGARDIHQLHALLLDHKHPLNREQVAHVLELDEDWELDELFELILEGRFTAQEIDRWIHRGIQ